MKYYCNNCYTTHNDEDLAWSAGKMFCPECRRHSSLCAYDPKLHNWWNRSTEHGSSVSDFVGATVAFILTMLVVFGPIALLLYLLYNL